MNRGRSSPSQPCTERPLVGSVAVLGLSLLLLQACTLTPDNAQQPPGPAAAPSGQQALAGASAETGSSPQADIGTPLWCSPAPTGDPTKSAMSPAARPVKAARKASQRPRKPAACAPTSRSGARVFLFPHKPKVGQAVRVVALSWQRSSLGQLTVKVNGKAQPLRSTARRFDGPPFSLEAKVQPTTAGKLTVHLSSKRVGALASCAERAIAAADAAPPAPPESRGIWPVTRQWDGWTEALFGAWVARLFYIPRGGRGGWLPLHQLTRDSSRNWLHNAMGWDEDDPMIDRPLELRADCGDLPFYLRAYFAWKLGLPFQFRRCTRGHAGTGPNCPVKRDNLVERFGRIQDPVARFSSWIWHGVGLGVHSGTARTLPTDNDSDYYPVALSARALRPGRIFVDPAGHVFVLSQQVTGGPKRLGIVFGVDAHPDKTISRKRFATGTFMFDAEVKTGGFKAFRPLVYDGGKIRRLTNAEIAAHPDYGDFSMAQAAVAATDDFYLAVRKALNPQPLDPLQVYRHKILALQEAVQERVKAVDMGEDYMRRKQYRPMPIPRGAAIFETTGPWELYSTPARDLRLLMAIRDVLHFPRNVRRRRALYHIPKDWTDEQLNRELSDLRTALTAALSIRYRRSDGSKWTLSLASIIERRQALRMAYNPNDCVEVRWGAAYGSQEFGTCRRRARRRQRESMRAYRIWFKLLRRPTLRG